MPNGAVGDQGVPSSGTPALSDPVTLENKMRYIVITQMLTHRYAGLPAADYQRIYLFNRHIQSPFSVLPGYLVILTGSLSDSLD